MTRLMKVLWISDDWRDERDTFMCTGAFYFAVRQGLVDEALGWF